MEEQPEKKVQTTWESMEQMLQAESAKLDPKKLKEMMDRWDGSMTKEELETDPLE